MNFLHYISVGSTTTLPAESPIPNLQKSSYVTPSKMSTQMSYSQIPNRRRTLSDYRNEVNSSITVNANPNPNPNPNPNTNPNTKSISGIKNATKTLASGLTKFTTKRMVKIHFTFYFY